MIIDPFHRAPISFLLVALSCVSAVFAITQIKSSDLIGGFVYGTVSYMEALSSLLTAPVTFVQNVFSETEGAADRAAAAGLSFYLLNYAFGVTVMAAIAGFRDLTWYFKWLIGGSVFGLAVLCGSSVLSSAFSSVAFNRILAIQGYLAGMQVVASSVGSLALLSITKSREPKLFELFKNSNWSGFPPSSRFTGVTWVLVGIILIGTYATVGFYGGALYPIALQNQSIPFLLAEGLLLLLASSIKKLFNE